MEALKAVSAKTGTAVTELIRQGLDMLLGTMPCREERVSKLAYLTMERKHVARLEAEATLRQVPFDEIVVTIVEEWYRRNFS